MFEPVPWTKKLILEEVALTPITEPLCSKAEEEVKPVAESQ
jgi:hypothetical protein